MGNTYKPVHQEQVPRKQGLKLIWFQPDSQGDAETSRASSTKTRIETSMFAYYTTYILHIKSKFHENKDWNLILLFCCVCRIPIKSKFHENKDWNIEAGGKTWNWIFIKSKFHENKDWNISLHLFCLGIFHQEQVPRKQGLKRHDIKVICSIILSSRASSTKTRIETLFLT